MKLFIRLVLLIMANHLLTAPAYGIEGLSVTATQYRDHLEGIGKGDYTVVQIGASNMPSIPPVIGVALDISPSMQLALYSNEMPKKGEKSRLDVAIDGILRLENLLDITYPNKDYRLEIVVYGGDVTHFFSSRTPQGVSLANRFKMLKCNDQTDYEGGLRMLSNILMGEATSILAITDGEANKRNNQETKLSDVEKLYNSFGDGADVTTIGVFVDYNPYFLKGAHIYERGRGEEEFKSAMERFIQRAISIKALSVKIEYSAESKIVAGNSRIGNISIANKTDSDSNYTGIIFSDEKSSVGQENITVSFIDSSKRTIRINVPIFLVPNEPLPRIHYDLCYQTLNDVMQKAILSGAYKGKDAELDSQIASLPKEYQAFHYETKHKVALDEVKRADIDDAFANASFYRLVITHLLMPLRANVATGVQTVSEKAHATITPPATAAKPSTFSPHADLPPMPTGAEKNNTTDNTEKAPATITPPATATPQPSAFSPPADLPPMPSGAEKNSTTDPIRDAFALSFPKITFGQELSNDKKRSIFMATLTHGNATYNVAVKKFPIVYEKESKLFKLEGDQLTKLRHENILDVYGVNQQSKNHFIVMAAASSDLHTYLRDPEHADLTWVQKLELSLEIAKGIAFLHSQSINHKRLRSKNVLIAQTKSIDGTDTLTAKLTGFGFVRLRKEKTSTELFKNREGTIRWRADEVFKMKYQPHSSADIYSLGMIMWELTTRRDPYAYLKNELDVIKRIEAGEKEVFPPDVPKYYKDIVESCWKVACERPNALKLISDIKAALDQAKGNSSTTN